MTKNKPYRAAKAIKKCVMPNISRQQKERIERTKYQRRHVGLLFILNLYFCTSEATTTCWLSLYNKSLFKPQKQRRHVAFSLYYPSVCTSEETMPFWPSLYIILSVCTSEATTTCWFSLYINLSVCTSEASCRLVLPTPKVRVRLTPKLGCLLDPKLRFRLTW